MMTNKLLLKCEAFAGADSWRRRGTQHGRALGIWLTSAQDRSLKSALRAIGSESP
jgi:hypothetical protein